MSVDSNQAKSIFLSAVEAHAPEEWGAYLDEACRGDAALRQRVETLLTAHRGEDKLFDDPGAVLVGQAGIAVPMEGPGTVIGRYKLLEKIGEGGMAVVYMAEQERPIRRKVALKIIKLGMDTRQVIARFEAERQALAMMDHPSIAKVLDAGATETGRPYFVMELVQGVSITEYCDGNSLNTKDRLALFVQVCHAVQHAHQKGIIHRDIKPSNVMVTHHDGKPVPKVIDFGIAKATNQRLTEKTLFTRYAHLIGTPAYMSPEQAELSDLDIDTRTDIYSLGVLLYELLTGTTPFSEEELRRAGYVEMQRVIREQEPVKPSTRIRTAHVAQPPSAGKSEGSPPRAGVPQGRSGDRSVYQQVRGDLDWIVMKTLEKDRSRRYDTAGGLAEDIRRHLEHEPVLARGPGVAYRVERFLRRHRSQVFAAVALVAITVGAVVILSMWNRDRAQLTEAEGFKHRNILSQAREQYAKAEREAALATINPIRDSKHVGPEARLLEATILVDNRRSKEATAILSGLLNERPEVAGAAHSLLARILWESGSPDAQKLQEIEEHRKQAESLLPETAEAYFLRAMTAVTVKEQLVSLDKALQLDPRHYESRRLRAFTYHASRKYEKMKDDALAMTILRDRDPLGFSLRAIAWRELSRYQEAIADYDSALSLTPQADPQHIDLRIQRCEMLLRMEEYERVVRDAQACFALSPDKAVFQYDIFCGLTALGEYDAGTTVFREIIAQGNESHQKFRAWCAKHVFDTLEAGRSWYLPEQKPVGAAFLPMVEAEETYRSLSTKGRRLTTDGFSANWSPDGKKLAFSLGVHGYSGVAIFDPATKETELLIVPGKDPRWSPDGKYIAFVRDCQALRLERFAAAEHRYQPRERMDEEVWVMRSDGTEPRRLARGGWPSWSQDSTAIYYQSRVDYTLCSISIEDQDAKPARIMSCYDFHPSVSPDNQRVAYLESVLLKVEDLASQTVVAEWPVPFATWGGAAWSLTGNELCLGGDTSTLDSAGLWFFAFDRTQPAQVLSGQIASGSWSPKATSLAFCLGPPYYEVWVANLDPSRSTVEALGTARTFEEYCQEMVRLHTRRIEADPEDAYAYSSRAQYLSSLGEREKASADMRQWSTVVSGNLPSHSPSVTPRDLHCVIRGPFGYQLVLSRTRGHDGTHGLRVAFGQKERREVELLEIPMWVTSLFDLSMSSCLNSPSAHATFTFGKPVNLGTVIPAIDGATDCVQCFSTDGLEMYVLSGRSGGCGNVDLWVVRRASTDDDWSAPENLGSTVNSPVEDSSPCISADGLALYFTSNRSGGVGDYDIYMTTRATKDAPWGPAVNLGPPINSDDTDGDPWISPDGLELYFASYRTGGYGAADIYVVKRVKTDDPWGAPVNLGPVVNSPYREQFLSLSPDGLLLLFQDHPRFGAPRPGGYGGSDMWMTRRASLRDPWQPPVNLGPTVNGPSHEASPRISPDGRTLYFGTAVDNWQVPIIPIADFNADGKVNLTDLVMLIESWEMKGTACDIGPFAWGDGKVDIEDLKVFINEWKKGNSAHSQRVP